ncbi:hypothetical protein [Urbifossiella limnaea]|uniref:hypothetical protein n=1 Tax=Urbifossiella limnaea TaxID=2528023 RepID=UPI00192E35F3|nr:hypothetical protein [Urbifossiella limnaea]
MEAEPHLEHPVRQLLDLGAVLLGVHHHLLPQVVLRLLVRVRGQLAGEPAAVAAGRHPHPGQAVGGLVDGAVVVGPEELAEREHGLREAVLDDARAGGGEQPAEVGAGVAGQLAELVLVEPQAEGHAVPVGAGGAHLGDPGQDFVGRGGHDGSRGRGAE